MFKDYINISSIVFNDRLNLINDYKSSDHARKFLNCSLKDHALYNIRFGNFLFRMMFLFSSFWILSTKVICKAATDLRKFQRRLTRRTIIMLDMRHTRLWTENCIFLEDTLMIQRYFSFCLRFRKITKLLIEIINKKI